MKLGSFTAFPTVFKDKKSLRSHKTIEIKVFLNFLLDDGSTVQIITDPDPVGPESYGSDPAYI
jgi:hypothetical protein